MFFGVWLIASMPLLGQSEPPISIFSNAAEDGTLAGDGVFDKTEAGSTPLAKQAGTPGIF